MSNSEKMRALIHLAGSVSHELNNIFTAVAGNLSLLDEHMEQGSLSAEMIGETIRTAQRGIELSAKLQAFAGRQPLQRTQLSVNRILGDIVRDVQARLPKSIELIFMPKNTDSSFFADETKLRATIGELIANAVAAITDSGKIYIQADEEYVTGNEGLMLRPAEYVIIRVCDTGKGMTPEIASRAMDPAFSTKPVQINSGWGLSNCAGFVRQSGGTMRIFSVPRHGTAIDLYLPAIASAKNASACA
jgi:signal transduction histidine kinase